MWRKPTLLSMAMESIDFQRNAAFFKELVAVCRGFEKQSPKQVGDSDLAMQLPAVIQHHTGLNASVYIGAGELAAYPAALNHNNPLFNCFTLDEREFMPNADADKILYRAQTNPIGRVNLKTGMVSGVFSQVPVIVAIPAAFLTGSFFTTEEKAAALLHELGHLVTFFLFLANTNSTNQILAAISRKYDTTSSVKEREVMLTKVKTLAQLSDLDAEALAKSNDKKVVQTVVVTSIVRQIQSELGSNLYDMNAWEQLSDQYAMRQGAGRHLVTALEKMHKAEGTISLRSLPKYLFVEALKLAYALMAPATSGISLIPLLVMCGADAQDTSGKYDSLKTRFSRMREQLVEAMKDQKLTEDELTSLSQDLTAIDDVMNEVKDRQQLLGYLVDFLSPIQRQRISQEKLQRELERLAHNDLFIHSAKLRQLV